MPVLLHMLSKVGERISYYGLKKDFRVTDFLILCYFKVFWIMDFGFRMMHIFLSPELNTTVNITWLSSKNHILLEPNVKSYNHLHKKYLFIYLLPSEEMSLFELF